MMAFFWQLLYRVKGLLQLLWDRPNEACRSLDENMMLDSVCKAKNTGVWNLA